MRRGEAWARERFGAAPVARLATVGQSGAPRLVPVVYAVAGSRIVTAVDHKPKSTTALRRLADIAEQPRVCLLVDEYADDWSQLWWARADGEARVVPALAPGDLAALVARYPAYAARPPTGTAIVVEVTCWSGWSAR
jgi:PPOX class probable F420-dependent enzyme